jgi:hypothetical protein
MNNPAKKQTGKRIPKAGLFIPLNIRLQLVNATIQEVRIKEAVSYCLALAVRETYSALPNSFSISEITSSETP